MVLYIVNLFSNFERQVFSWNCSLSSHEDVLLRGVVDLIISKIHKRTTLVPSVHKNVIVRAPVTVGRIRINKTI